MKASYRATAVRGRVFLVGCPRSGTTLLQSLLAGHKEICSFPESHFFVHLQPGRTVPRLIGLRSRRSVVRLDGLAREIDPGGSWRGGWTMTAMAAGFVDLLDRVTMARGGTIWVEKTPDHIFRIPLIEQLVEGATFVHILRDPRETIASIVEVSNRHPDGWGGPWSIDRCVEHWNRAATITRERSVDRARHHVLHYEDLVADTGRELGRLCDFLDVEVDDAMVDRRELSRIVRPDEPWKRSVDGGITLSHGRFERLFDEDQQAYIIDRVIDLRD